MTITHILITHEHDDHVVDLERVRQRLGRPGRLRSRQEDCFTGDALFRGTLGGQREPGPAAFEEVRASVMERLLALDGDTNLHPGHASPTTVARELGHNPFVRIWRGLDPMGVQPCRVASAFGWEATLVLKAPDYDGGTKAWVRFPRGGDAIIGGSQVHPADDGQRRAAAR